jgi:hypothetical protein
MGFGTLMEAASGVGYSQLYFITELWKGELTMLLFYFYGEF